MPGVPSWPQPLASAYAMCERLARSHYENFPVASRLLPRRMRPHVAAVYAFARGADDIADEGTAPAAERRDRLRAWQQRLHHAAAGDNGGQRGAEDYVFVAVGHTIRSLNLPLSLFDDLVSAFGQDTMTHRYASWTELLDYCRRSANPVGRLVLRIAGHRDEALDRSSDALCTALQLTNFWQDYAIDWKRGRLYLPREEWEAVGAAESDLVAGRITPPWRGALASAAQRTRALFDEGRAVCDLVEGRLRYELRLTWLGGTLILDRLDVVGYDVFASRPTIERGDIPSLAWRALRWSTHVTPRPRDE
jgi:hydroxysqualene synthase